MNDTTARPGSFDAYLADFLALKRDVGLMLSNADEHSGPQGPRTFYAVDFSEIYAYTYPDATKNEVRLFSQETDVDPTQQFGINEHLLENIFFSPQDAPILLSPYAVELQRFARTIHDDQIARVLEAAKQLQELRSSGHLDEIVATYKNRPTGGLTAPEVGAVMKIVEEHAPLLSVLVHEPLSSVQRFRHLLTSSKFEDARNLVGGQSIDIDTDISGWWYDKLIEIRGAGRAFYCDMDAVAMAQLTALNQTLSREHRRIRLVTRSPTMHRLFRERRKLDAGRDPYMLCHPRGFLVHPDLLHGSDLGEQARETLKKLGASLEFLTRSGALVQPDDNDGAALRSERFRNHSHLHGALQPVRHQWHTLANLVLSADLTWTRRGRSIHRSKDYKFARDILKLVVSDARLREEVQRRVAEIGKDLMLRHETLPYSAQLPPEIVGNYLEQRLALEPAGPDAMTLAPKALRFMNYRRIEFYADFIRERALRGNAKSVIMQFLRHPEAVNSSDYERRLAMAYLLAISDYWELAETYCELANSTPEATQDVPRHEVHYLLAICKRCNQPSRSRLLEAANHLTIAQQLKLDRQCDPRYLAERAVVILALRADAHANGSDDLPSLQEALDASNEAIALLEPDDEMLVPIYNNLCYAFLRTEARRDLDEARKYYDLLREALARIEKVRANWPPRVLDTVVCAELAFDPQPPADKLRTLLQQLRGAMSSSAAAVHDKHLLEKRCRELENMINPPVSAGY